ncbi:MAG: S-layer homology domain-containing protein, partial [Clostridia bacterium]|nr:S-layer homology domain-containing protein [Clostridia bacterium]
SQDTIKCGSKKVASVDTLWYRDNELITGAHEVRFGNYFAKVTVYPAKGYKFSSKTEFTLMGEKPLMANEASDGSYAVLWSNLYKFECDHSYNEDWTVHYDEAGHYQQCTVCGAKIAYEKHTMNGGSAFGNITTYSCTACGYAYDEENGRVKLNGLVVDIPVALAGDTIPTPELVEEFKDVAKITSFEFTSASGAKLGPGDVYTDGDTVTATVTAKANDGYYFIDRARMNCAATTLTTCTVNDDVITSTYTIKVYTRYAATVILPSLAPGMTMGEYLDQVEAKVGVKDSGNIQFTISTHGQDDEVYVRKTLSGGWQLVRGAKDLDTFVNTKIKPETAYDLSFDFSTDGVYVSEGDILCYSPASYAGLKYEGGETWFSIGAVAVSDSNEIGDIRIVGVMTPLADSVPETDFEVLNTSALEPYSSKWDADGRFDYDTEYTFTAKVKLKDDFRFADKLTASVNGISAKVSVSGDMATVKYTFPATEQALTVTETETIKTVELTLATPKIGEKASFDAVVPAGAKYTVVSVNWFCDEDNASLKSGDVYEKKTYILDVTLTPAEGCAFANDAELSGILNGAPAQLRRIEGGNAILTKYFTPGDGETGAFVKSRTYADSFADVTSDKWFYPYVKTAYEYTLANGTSATKFSPDDKFTVAQALTAAVNIHKAYFGKDVDLSGGNPWYTPYVSYCIEAGIIKDGQFDSYDRSITRGEMATVFANILPDGEYAAVRSGSCPDVTSDMACAAAVAKLFAAGIVGGDAGTGNYRPNDNIVRSEACVIFTRIAAKEYRAK